MNRRGGWRASPLATRTAAGAHEAHLVLTAGVDVDLGLAEDDGGDFGAGRPMGIMTPPIASVTS